MNKINLINLKIDTNMDADDYGNRIVNAINNIKDLTDVVNIVKIKFGEHISKAELPNIITPLRECFKSIGATNCVFVPLIPGLIEDVTVDKVEVIHVNTDEQSD